MRIKLYKPDIVEIDMTPMIDVVFQLIAFFMLVINFEQTQADERVRLPQDELARPPVVPHEREVFVNIGFVRDRQTGRIIDPTPYVFSPEGTVAARDYGAELRLEARVAQAKKIDPKTMTIVIRADAEVPTGIVQEIIKRAQDYGFEKFVLKAKSKALEE
jgi:biopolymer transport protein ExbD